MRVFRLTAFFLTLAFLFVGTPLFAVTESGDINISGTIPTPPPEQAPTIDEPKAGTTFDTKNITVSGKCTADLIVKIYSNNIFVGSTICQPDGTYSLKIDLFQERNDLVARQFDQLNQPSPDSATVTVYYVPPEQQPQLPGETPVTSSPEVSAPFQLIIDYDYTVQGVYVNQPFRLPVQFRGGTAPYTVTINWGDGSSNRFQRNTADSFDTTYTYTHPGRYIVTIRVTDSAGQSAYLQFVTIVHGQADSPGTITMFGQEINQDMALIIILIVAALLVLAFLAGKSLSLPAKIDK